jgi:hypothetical protein
MAFHAVFSDRHTPQGVGHTARCAMAGSVKTKAVNRRRDYAGLIGPAPHDKIGVDHNSLIFIKCDPVYDLGEGEPHKE